VDDPAVDITNSVLFVYPKMLEAHANIVCTEVSPCYVFPSNNREWSNKNGVVPVTRPTLISRFQGNCNRNDPNRGFVHQQLVSVVFFFWETGVKD
jgi:hypothetical protein